MESYMRVYVLYAYMTEHFAILEPLESMFLDYISFWSTNFMVQGLYSIETASRRL